MKILRLHIKNINSLKGDHTVRFNEGTLSESGLFAITGPTGSGKSTLLDAITLALFNRIPRLTGQSKITKKIVEEEGAILTQHTKEALAEVEYSSNGKHYRSSWSIAVNRNGNLNDRKMELADAQTGEIISSNHNEVVDHNQQIIGLTYEQFVQSIILAQGKFDELLKAGEHERNKLLEELTGGQIYRRIGIYVHHRAKKIESEVDSLKDRLGEVKVLSAEERKELEKSIKQNEPQLQKLKGSLEKLRKQKNIKERIQELQKQEQEVKEEIIQLKEQEKEIQPLQQQLKEHEKVSSARTPLQEYDRLQSEKSQLEKEQKDLAEKKVNVKKQKKSFLEATEKWLNAPVKEERLEEQINAFEKEVSAAQEKLKELRQQAEKKSESIDDRIKTLNRSGIEFHRSEQTLKEVERKKSEIADRKKEIGIKDADQVKEQLNVLEKDLQNLELIIERKSRLEEKESYRHKSNERFQTGLKKKKVLEAEAKSSQKQIEKYRPQLEKAQQKWRQFEAAQQLEAQRSELEDDQPCPLCGSEHHPYADHFETEKADMLKKEQEHLKTLVEEAEKNEQRSQAEIKALSNQLEELEKESAPLKAEIKQLTEALHEQISKLSEQPAGFSLEEWKEFRVHRKKQNADFEVLKKQLEVLPVLSELEELQKSYTELRNTFKEQQQDVKKKYSGEDIHKESAQRIRSFFEHQKDLSHLDEQEKKTWDGLKTKLQDIQAREKLLKEVMKKHGLTELNELRSKLLSDDQQQEIRQRIDNFNKKKERLSGELKNIDKNKKELVEQDDDKQTLPQLNEQITEAETKTESLLTTVTTAKEKLKRDDEDKKRHGELNKELQRYQKDQKLWETMNKLIGSATGNKFSNFVQDLTLRQLIHYGNERLNTFEERYQIAPPEANNRDALRIIDRHLGNTERSVSSLSGGETFKVSLALALGLSDLAAREVRIDSLFIDEGFGTLDPESLDMAITLLEQMQSESNKSIGIISHVTELKDRIGAKVKLIPDGNGYSRVEVE